MPADVVDMTRDYTPVLALINTAKSVYRVLAIEQVCQSGMIEIRLNFEEGHRFEVWVQRLMPPEYRHFITRDCIRDGYPWRSWDWQGVRVSWPVEIVSVKTEHGGLERIQPRPVINLDKIVPNVPRPEGIEIHAAIEYADNGLPILP